MLLKYLFLRLLTVFLCLGSEPIFFLEKMIYALNLKSNYNERIRFMRKRKWKCTESFVKNMQSEISAWRAKRIYCVQFSEKAVLDRHPKESVIFFRNSLKKEKIQTGYFKSLEAHFWTKLTKLTESLICARMSDSLRQTLLKIKCYLPSRII